MTLAQRYNDTARALMPFMFGHLRVDDHINDALEIDEIVFRRGEYVGGMAAVIISVVARADT